MGLLSFIIWVSANRMMAAQIASAILPGVVKIRVMTFLALIAIIFFGFAVYNLTCAFVDIPTKKTSQ